MSMRPTDDREYIRDTARTGSGNREPGTNTTRVVTIAGGEGAALPPAGTMSREFTEVFGYFGRRVCGFFLFPYRIGRRLGGGLRKSDEQSDRSFM